MNLLLILCIFISIISQIPPLEPLFRPLMYVCWIITFLYILLTCKGRLKFSNFTIYFSLAYSVYISYCLACSSIFGTSHLESSYMQLLFIPLMLCVIADTSVPRLSHKWFHQLIITYVIAALIFAVWVHMTYFISLTAWRGSVLYDFAQKNSAAQIWGAAILINLFLIPHKTKLGSFIKYGITGYFLFLILFSHCRTALLGLSIVFLWNIIKYSRHKILWLVVCGMLIIGYLFISPIQDIISHGLFLTKYAGADFDSFSSGRLGLYKLAFQAFLTSPLIGVGDYYVDNSYLCILTQSGIIGFLLVESIWMYKIILQLKGVRVREYTRHEFLNSLLIFYIVESILEGYPPFGPGVSAMAFWFFGGILLKRMDLIRG